MNHYQILNLPTPSPSTPISPQTIKQAYHAALLKHHPDKSPAAHTTQPSSSSSSSSIDAIKHAYTTLSNPTARAAYDNELRLTTSQPASAKTGGSDSCGFRTGEEPVDLDDLAYDAERREWYRACRCGLDRGFVVTEAQLEREEALGGSEVLVGCLGCSLWLSLAFGLVDDQEQEQAAS